MGREMSEAILGVGSLTERWLGEPLKLEARRLEELLLRSVGHCGLGLVGRPVSVPSVLLLVSVTVELGALLTSAAGEGGT